jgi:hypothetical protein
VLFRWIVLTFGASLAFLGTLAVAKVRSLSRFGGAFSAPVADRVLGPAGLSASAAAAAAGATASAASFSRAAFSAFASFFNFSSSASLIILSSKVGLHSDMNLVTALKVSSMLHRLRSAL